MILWTTLAFASDLPTAATPDAGLDEARARALVGDFAGMRIAAEHALGSEGPHVNDARYLVAMAFELNGDPATALQLYESLLGGWTGGDFPVDVEFRRVVALWRVDRCPEGLTALQTLELQPAVIDSGPSTQLQLSVIRGACEVAVGDVKDGVQRLTDTLDTAALTDAPIWQAEARRVLIDVLVNQATLLPFSGSDRKRRKIADTRSALVKAARDQLAPLIRLNQPGVTLSAFLDVIEANESFVDALEGETVPRSLRSVAQQETWKKGKADLAEKILLFTDQLLDRGLLYAGQSGWMGPEGQALEAAKERVHARIEG